MKSEKIAIIGAGINGLYLANKLADQYKDIEVFEKKQNVFGKVCSGLISERIFDYIKRDEKYILNKITRCLIHYPKKDVWLKMKPAHYVCDRDKINEILFNQAQNKGVIFHFGQEIKELPPNFDKIIMSCGAFSAVTKRMSMANQNFYLGLQFFGESVDRNDYVETWAHETGFFWRIPRGKDTEYGVLGSPQKLYEKFEKFCQEKNWPFQREKIMAATIPQGLPQIVDGNIALCGDAAGLCKPWSGGGVIWGLTAADILLKEFDDFNKYQTKVYNLFQPIVLKGKIAKNLAWFLGNKAPFFLPSAYTRDNDFPLF